MNYDYISVEDMKASENLINKEAERSVLGTFLVEPETQQALDIIPVSIFTGIEQTIAQSFKKLHENIENITVVELMEQLKKDKTNIDISTISNLASYQVPSYQQKRNIKLLKELSQKRKYYEYLKNALKEASEVSELDGQVFDLINRLESLKSNLDSEEINDINTLINKSMDRIENSNTQIKFGYSLLDKNIGGVKPGDYTIIGAKSGVGKTTLALNIALNVLKQEKKVLIISREMSDVDVLDRFITMISDIPTIKFKNKDFKNEEWQKYIKASSLLSQFNDKLIIDNSATKITDILKLVRKYKPDLVVIDYLQLLSAEDGSKLENAERIIANISRNIRIMTLKYNCHVMALVQLNNSFKGLPHGENVIRQSATVYQDATAVIYLHDLQEIEDVKYTYSTVGGIDDEKAMDIINTNKEKQIVSKYAFKLDKNRNGATGIEPITFIRPSFKMYDNEGLKNI